jgi:zinc D-Ala-D-Ala carboxypeptidase
VRPASTPNYQLRRLVALTALVVVGYSVVRIGGAVGSAFQGDGGAGASGPAPSAGVSPTPTSTTGAAAVAVPACAEGSQPAENASAADWRKTLLDTRYRLPSTYEPPILQSVTRAGFSKAGGFVVRSVVIDDLKALRGAAAAAGTPIEIVAAYRSFEQQATLFQKRKKDLGLTEAKRKTARPGHSEHQLGTAIDFKTQGATDVSVRWDSTATGQWMLENAWTFGFIQSYPQGSSDVTCYGYEPWHYRYVGRDVAAAIHQSGLTVREYLWNQAHRLP